MITTTDGSAIQPGAGQPEITDAAFKEQLRSYLAQFSEGRKPIVALIRNADGSIDREKTLALPCYQGLVKTPES